MEALDIIPLTNKIDFILVEPQSDGVTKLKVKTLEEATYGDYISYQFLSEDSVNNLPLIVKSFIKDELSEQEILDIGMKDALACFFLQRQSVIQLMKRSQRSLKWKLRKEKLMQIMNKTLCWKKNWMKSKNSKTNTVGTD